MFRPGIFLTLLVAIVAAKRRFNPSKLLAAADEKQGRILDLFTGLGTEDVYGHEHQPFPYDDSSLYTNHEALKNFTTYWNEGFLVKYGTYTLNCERTIRDTLTFYKLLNATIDFETFYKVANWAKFELHPEMYLYTTYSALLERPDTMNITLPPLYEILPSYFVPSNVLYHARNSFINGVSSRTFQINNTGWEWTWHRSGDMASPHVVHHTDRRSYDVETRLSYFREDVRGLNFIVTHFLYYGLTAPGMVKNGTIERLGEIRYAFLRWILARYNLERYAVGLPKVKPIQFEQPIMTGYDPQIVGMYGRFIPPRIDNAIPQDIDPEGVAAVEKIVSRVQDMVQAGVLRNWTENGFLRHLEGIEAANVIGNKLIHGDNKYYPSLYFNLLSLIDGLVSSSNRIGYGTGTLLNPFTVARDPAYYQILAYVNRHFTKLHSQHKPYTRKELGFPGVKITDVEVSNLETYFEYQDFNISNIFPGDGGNNYKASQFSINNYPFDITVRINSEKQTNAIVKIFLAPASDVRNDTLDLNEFRKSLVPYYSFPAKLQPGENSFKKSVLPDPRESWTHQQGGSYIRQWCYYPRNLMLPKGTEGGTPYVFYVMAYPYNGDATRDDTAEYDTKETCIKRHLLSDYEHTLLFPIDRHWERYAVNQSNHKAVETLIYHKEDTVPSQTTPSKLVDGYGAKRIIKHMKKY